MHWDVSHAVRALSVALLISASAADGRLVAQGPKADEKETETIRGTVVNSATYEPIGRALEYSVDRRFAVICDEGGHFEFKIPRAKNEAPHGRVPMHCWRVSQYNSCRRRGSSDE